MSQKGLTKITGLFNAIRFLTVIPLPGQREYRSEEIGRSIVYFPVVGMIIGFILAGLNWLLRHLFPASLVSALLIIFLAVITGGLHLDGFIDTCDALAGNHTVQERWQIMHESRVGAFGVIGAVLLLLLQYASMNSLPDSILPRALMLMLVVSRWGMVYAIWVCPYARPDGLGKIFKNEVNLSGFSLATLTTLAIAALFFRFSGIIIMFGTWLIITGLALHLKSKFAGLTGDSYGAVNEVAEVSVLILISIMTNGNH